MYEDYKRVYIDNIKTEYFVSRDGNVISKYKNKIHEMKVFETEKGYQYVKLWINNKSVAAFIHRLVASAYIPNPKNKPEVNHKDGIKSNNFDWNLEWVTSKENKKHAKEMNLLKPAKCEKQGKSKYTNKQIKKVCKLLEKNKHTLKEISIKTSVSLDTIYSIRSKGIWTDISKNYTFPKNPHKVATTYTHKQIKKVCKLLSKGKSIDEITNKTKVKKGTIKDIYKRRRWKDISVNYKF